MIPSETPGMRPFGPENPPIFPPNSGLTQSNNLTAFQFSRFLTSLPNYQTTPQAQDFAPNPSGISSNSTSDEAEDHQVRMIDERKQRRMISNRESARRSRMRKQRRLDDLASQVLLLRDENCKLMDSLKHEVEGHQRVLQENVRLKEEVFDLRRMLTELHECNSYTSLKDL